MPIKVKTETHTQIEYKTISVGYQGVEIFVKQNVVGGCGVGGGWVVGFCGGSYHQINPQYH